MEEVDGIIIHSLRSIGCDIEEEVQSIQQFSTELIVEATATCIKVINNDVEISHKLPPSMSARFRVGTALATAVTDLGYRGEVGYQTFLYSNEADVRKVLMFLIEKLPRDSGETTEDTLGSSDLLRRSIAAEISRQMACPWTPSFFKKNGIAWRGNPPTWHREGCSSIQDFRSYHVTVPSGVADMNKKIPKELRNFYKNNLPLVTSQPPQHSAVAPSLLEMHASSLAAQQEWEMEWNTMGLPSRLSPEEYKARKREKLKKKITEHIQEAMANSATTQAEAQDLLSMVTAMSQKTTTTKTKGSRFTHTEKLQFAPDEDKAAAQLGVAEGPRVESQEDLQKKQEEELEALRGELSEINAQIQKLDLECRKMNTSKQQMDSSIETSKKEKEETEESLKIKKRTLDLLPEADQNIEKLKALIDGSNQRLINLANQWEKRRVPLIEQIRELQQTNANKSNESELKLEEIKELREKMKQAAGEARNKEDIHKQLMSEYERLTKDVNRSAYTRKIMEIVSNIKKQKEEIDKVLMDTKTIQKEINMSSGKLDRTFTVTDELIFRDAKKDEAVRKAYKYLASLHENCSILVKTVEETGFIVREIRELEDQIEQESTKKITSNLDKITADYQQIKSENTALIEKLKKQQAS